MEAPVFGSNPGLQLYSTWHWAQRRLESDLLRSPIARKGFPSRWNSTLVIVTLLLFSFYPLTWAFIHTFNHFQRLPAGRFDYRFSDAVAAAFSQSPHSFLVGGFTLMLSFQLISLGILALQSNRYFEELFHLATSIYKSNRENNKELQNGFTNRWRTYQSYLSY